MGEGGPKDDPEIESAKEDIARAEQESGDGDGDGDGDGEQPTVDQQGAMTADQGDVEDANAAGVNPDA